MLMLMSPPPLRDADVVALAAMMPLMIFMPFFSILPLFATIAATFSLLICLLIRRADIAADAAAAD